MGVTIRCTQPHTEYESRPDIFSCKLKQQVSEVNTTNGLACELVLIWEAQITSCSWKTRLQVSGKLQQQ